MTLQLGHALPEHRIGDVGDAVLDRVVQPLELDAHHDSRGIKTTLAQKKT